MLNIVRILLFVLLSAAAGIWGCKLMHDPEARLAPHVAQKCVSEPPAPTKDTAGELLHQSTEFQGWAVLILGAVIAMVITTKVHPNSSPEWTFILLGPSVSFLSFSFLAAWELKKRYNYLLLHNNFDDVMSLASYLQVQFKLFGWAIGTLTLFATCFLCLILVRRVKPEQGTT